MSPIRDPKVALALVGGLLALLVVFRRKVPAAWQQELAGATGFVGSVVYGLAGGHALVDAFDQAILLTFGGLVAGHVAMRIGGALDGASKGGASNGPPTPKSPRTPPSETLRVSLAWGVLLTWFVAGMACAGCTAAERQTAAGVAQVAVPACTVGLSIADAPELVPICATLPEIEAAIASLFAERHAAAGTMSEHASIGEWKPSGAEIHRRIMKMRAAAIVDGGVR